MTQEVLCPKEEENLILLSDAANRVYNKNHVLCQACNNLAKCKDASARSYVVDRHKRVTAA